MGLPWPLFVYFCSFQTQILRGIQTLIVKKEGEHADHTYDHHHGPKIYLLQHCIVDWKDKK